MGKAEGYVRSPRDGEEDAQREERVHRGCWGARVSTFGGPVGSDACCLLLGQLLGAGESCTSGPQPGWGS